MAVQLSMSVVPHKFHYNSALELPKTAVVTGNAVLLQHILDDLKFRIRETEQLKSSASPVVPDAQIVLLNGEIDNLKGQIAALQGQIVNLTPRKPPAPAVADPKIAELEAEVAELQGRLLNHTPRKAAVPAVADPKIAELQRQVDDLTAGIARAWVDGGPPEVAKLNRIIQRQRLQIRDFEAHHSNNTLHDLLCRLQRVLELHLDDDNLYRAVAQAIYDNTSRDVRDSISPAVSNGDEWIAYVAHILKDPHEWEQYDTDQHNRNWNQHVTNREKTVDSSDSTEEGSEYSETEVLPDTGNNRQKTPRPESAKAKGFRRKAQAAVSGMLGRAKRGFGFGEKSTADLSSLLSDLKRVSDAGTTCSVDADVPPT